MLGTAFGVALGFFLFPVCFPAATGRRAADATEPASTVVAEGRFIHANPSDPVHWGKGGVTVRRNSVFLGPDFEVGPGPKFHVYLVPRAQIRTSGDLSAQMFVDLGRLRAFKGSQRYAIPAGLDLELPERDHLVRAVLGADLAGRPDPQSRLGRRLPCGCVGGQDFRFEGAPAWAKMASSTCNRRPLRRRIL